VIESQAFWSSDGKCYSSLLEDIWSSRKPSTVQNYCYSLRRFFAFCFIFRDGVTLPIDSVLAANYLSFLKNNAGKKGAVTTAFCALKWIHNFIPSVNRFNDPLEDKLVKSVCESARRNIVSKSNVKKPLPPDFVDRILRSSDQSSLLDLRNCVIIALAYSLLLRHDEISFMSCYHISLIVGGLKFFIPSSKTDVYNKGKDVFLAKNESRFSVYSLLMRYFTLANLHVGQDHFLFGPLSFDPSSKFMFVLNEKLSYNSYRKILRDKLSQNGLSPDSFGFHSCRKGGATSLASSVTTFELLSTGRWQDPRSLSHYVEVSSDRKLEISKKLFSS
jgi:integrase